MYKRFDILFAKVYKKILISCFNDNKYCENSICLISIILSAEYISK